MKAEWNVNATAAMSSETNLRNLCRQMEQEYIDWSRPITYRGYVIAREWPAIGELGRYGVPGMRVRFVTTRQRSIQVRDTENHIHGEVKIRAGMARELYVMAGQVAEIIDYEETE